jgi:hypothetical protein
VRKGLSVTITRERGLAALVVLNVLLQVLDGVLTYAGVVRQGFPEGNPLVAWAMHALGPGAALSLLKLEACACLLLVWTLRHRSRLVRPALAATAVLYTGLSLGPWSAILAR